MINLYKFGHLLFPGFSSPGMLKTLLDLENEMKRVLLNIPSKERDRIQAGLSGITIDLKIVVSDKGVGEIISVPLHIQPEAVMKRALLGKGPSVDLDKQLAEMKKGLFEFIQKEGTRMIKESVEGFFRGKVKEGIKGAVKALVRAGAITRTGRLAPETTIEDLLVGKYSELFSRAATTELVNEGLLIEQTLLSLYEWGELDMEEWAQEVGNDLKLIGNSLTEMKSEDSSSEEVSVSPRSPFPPSS